MLRTLLTAILIFSTSLSAGAQQNDTAIIATRRIASKAFPHWPEAQASIPREVQVVTLARLGARQKCYIRDLTRDSLTCESGHHHQTTTYTREEIAALIEPPSHHQRNLVLIPVALMVASLVASFFVPLAASVTLRILTGLFFCAFGAMASGDDGSDHSNDILLYQRPNTPLTLNLRTR